MPTIHNFISKLKLSCAGRDNLNSWKQKWDVVSLLVHNFITSLCIIFCVKLFYVSATCNFF